MAGCKTLKFRCFVSFILTSAITNLFCSAAADEDRKVYIVYMGAIPDDGEYSPSSHHVSLLQEVVQDSSIADVLVKSYKRSFNGFAAKLTERERQKLAVMKGVVSVFPSKTYKLHTTESWDFMGLAETATPSHPNSTSDVIIGVIDSGIWPESPSFSDKGFGPPPKKWKGKCEGGKNFTCNNKIIGARFYSSIAPVDSARDDNGHGSHTASTAAGNIVKHVSFYGIGSGNARGGVPSARIAAYKACGGCGGADILAAFDDAIADGVDVLTVSLGLDSAADFTSDEIAIGSFHAMAKGIITVNSAGNTGPDAGSVTSVAPWMISVAASTTERRIITKVGLGNGKILVGSSVNAFSQVGKQFPLVYGSNASSLCSEVGGQLCSTGCLDKRLVEGKIVVCDQSKGTTEASTAGAIGSVVQTSAVDNIAFVGPIPSSTLGPNDYETLKSYISSTNDPQATISWSETIKDSTAPLVASFSSRGPNLIVPDIMKPDVTAPGVDILAAFAPIFSPSGGFLDKRRVDYNIISGTSMSCPHVAATAAIVKKEHPDWSPAAIKSAIMTTAWPMNSTNNKGGEFAYGSGHVNPLKAISPGLVYNATKEDYIKLLCSLGYDSASIGKISGDNNNCTNINDKSSPKDFNYPSMTSRISPFSTFNIQFQRTVTNVGNANSTYKAKVHTNSVLQIKVVPDILSFKSLQETKSFNVTVSGRNVQDRKLVSASLVWDDGVHSVRSPIVVQTL